MKLKYCKDCGTVYYKETECQNYECVNYLRYDLESLPKEAYADNHENNPESQESTKFVYEG